MNGEQHKVTIRLVPNGGSIVEIASLYPNTYLARTFVQVDPKTSLSKEVAKALDGHNKGSLNHSEMQAKEARAMLGSQVE